MADGDCGESLHGIKERYVANTLLTFWFRVYSSIGWWSDIVCRRSSRKELPTQWAGHEPGVPLVCAFILLMRTAADRIVRTESSIFVNHVSGLSSRHLPWRKSGSTRSRRSANLEFSIESMQASKYHRPCTFTSTTTTVGEKRRVTWWRSQQVLQRHCSLDNLVTSSPSILLSWSNTLNGSVSKGISMSWLPVGIIRIVIDLNINFLMVPSW